MDRSGKDGDNLEDCEIIKLFYERSEDAISETRKKYAKTCLRIAENILNSKEDSEECVNDAYLALWNSIPPEKPDPLSCYLYRIVRNLSIKKYRMNTAVKRNGHYDLSIDEIGEIFPSDYSCEDEIVSKELSRAINSFLETIDKENRVIFVLKYWYCDSVSDISEKTGISTHNISVRLSRIRGKLKKYLIGKGFLL